MSKKVATVLVTYNRLDLLKQTIKDLLEQSVPIDKIYMINNASTDGTSKYLHQLKDNDKFKIINLKKNVGGAGGFSEGLKVAHDDGPYDYYWLMDDDTLPNTMTLSELLKVPDKVGQEIGFLSSNVRWKNGEPAIMNIPHPTEDWNDKADEGLVKIDWGSFVSMLVSNKALEKVGLPIKEFFIWGDDVEFSQRISKFFPSYFVSNSIVEHATKTNTGTSGRELIKEKSDKINRYFYNIRNRTYINRELGNINRIKGQLSNLYLFNRVLFSKTPRKFLKLKVITKGITSGWFFKPKVTHVTVNNKL